MSAEKQVVSIFGGISKLFGYTPQRPSRESLNTNEEPGESESPLDVLNKEALKSKSINKTLNPNTRAKRKGAVQENPNMRKNAVAEARTPSNQAPSNQLGIRSETTHENGNSFPRGRKRPRGQESEMVASSNSPKRREWPGSTLPLDADYPIQISMQQEHDLSPGLQGRRDRENATTPAQIIHDPYRSPNADQPSFQARKTRSSARTNSRILSTDGPRRLSPKQPVEVPKDTRRQLRRPTAPREATKTRTSRHGEETFEFNADSTPKQHRKLPSITANSPRGRKSRTRQAAKKTGVCGGPTTADEHVTENSSFKGVAPKKKGYPKRSAEKRDIEEHDLESSARATAHQRQRLEQSPNARSKTSPKEKLFRQGAPVSIEISEQGDMEEESSSGMETEEDDSADEDYDSHPADRSSEDMEQAIGGRASVGNEPDPAFLGEHDAWTKVVEAASKNYLDVDTDTSTNGKNAHRMTTHATNVVLNLSVAIQKTSKIYMDLIKGKSIEQREQRVDESLSDSIDQIESQIKAIREFDFDDDGAKMARKGRAKTIRDIYERGVPDLVDLLNVAMVSRSSGSPEVYSLKAIEQIVRLQSITIHLCRTAVNWTTQPHSADKPIIRNVRSIVFPILRDKIFKVFTREMQRLWIIERKRQNRERTQAQSQLELDVEHEAANQEVERRAEELRRMEEDIRLNHAAYRARCLGLPSFTYSKRSVSVSVHARYASQQTESNDNALWTLDEERELLKQLQKKHSRDLPAPERYLKILNAQSLQNKLPEHIQRKALELKPFLMEILGEADYVRSIV